ncbi:conserved hypothetical protein [Listeria monocytogenes J2818]|nr:conserved hypothetical protein [Listeria monocytogenes J2818]
MSNSLQWRDRAGLSPDFQYLTVCMNEFVYQNYYSIK